MNKDFINILQEIRGTGAPGDAYTNGIWYELTTADKNGNSGVYGDILFMYNFLFDNGGVYQGVIDNMTQIDGVYNNLTAINSLYADKAKLDSLFADKATLDSLYADKATLDSLYADKAKLDSLFADKATLDAIAADLATIVAVHNNRHNINQAVANQANINAAVANELNINAVVANTSNINAVALNIANIVAVNANKANIDIVAGDTAAINQVASDTAAINNIANNPLRQSILDVDANKNNINQVSGNVLNINTVAGDTAAINDITSEPLRSSVLAAGTNATNAQLRAWEAEAERLTADSYATEAEDVPVNIVTSNGNGTFTYTPTSPAEFSSFHWRTKAQTIVSGGLTNFARYGVVTGLDVTINGIDNTTYDISPGEYYIGDTLYTYPGSTGNATGLLAGQTLLTVGLDASLNIVGVKDDSLSDDQRLVVVEIGALSTAGGATTIQKVDESGFKATNVIARLHVRTKNYIETVFDGTAAKISESSTPLQLDIAAGTLHDAEMDSKTVTGASNIGGVEALHDGGGNWITNSVATHVINTSQYDNGTGLVAATAGRFLAIDISRSSRTETVYLTKPQGEYVTFSQALNSPYSDNAIFNTKGLDVVPVARVIVKVGDTAIRFIQDYRSVIPKLDRPDITTEGTNNLSAFGNGAIVETVATNITSDGVTVTFHYSDPNNGHLTCQFDEQNFLLANGSIALTAGTDVSPTRNFVYTEVVGGIVQASVNTSQFPATAHCPIAEVLVPSAATVQSEGVYAFQAWIDHMSDAAGFGHLHDINYWIRQQGATYISGMDTTTVPAVGGGTVVNGVTANITAGVMLQLHQYTSSAIDVAVGGMRIINHPTTPFLKVNNLDVLVDSTGAALDNQRYNLVLMVCTNEDSTKGYINLPNGFYATDEGAINDSNNLSDYTIPAEFTGKTILAARITLRHRTVAGGSYEVLNIAPLQGLNIGGGGSSSIKNEYFDNEFKIVDDLDPTKEVQFQVSGVTTGTGRTMSIPDENGTLALGTIADFEAALNY